MLFRRLLFCSLVLFLALAGWLPTVQAQTDDDPLRVGVSLLPPFAVRYEDGWDGVAIELWEDISRALDLDYTYVEVEAETALDLLEVGQLDLVLTAAPTTLTESRFDFSHSYYTTYIAFAESPQRTVGDLARALFTPRFLRVALSLTILLLLVGFLAWIVERRQNEQFGGKPHSGIWSGFWWAAVTMTTLGYGDKTPVTTAGRVLALIWMLVALGITATLTATITSLFTTTASSSTQFPQDLRTMRVGAPDLSAAARYLDEEGIPFEGYEDAAEGMRSVLSGENDIFVYDSASLAYLNRQVVSDGLDVISTRGQPRHLAFALREDDPLLEPLNIVLLEEINSQRWQALLDRWLPEQS